MDWFTSNPLAQMPGPSFLLLYVCAAVVTVVMAAARIRAADTTAETAPFPVPTDPDPYEVAYLRGGGNEVTRAVIFSLIERGCLTVSDEKDPKKQQIGRVPNPLRLDALSPLERRVFDWFSRPYKAQEVFQSNLPQEVEPHCAPYEARLRMNDLLAPSGVATAGLIAWLAGAAVITFLGGYKLVASLLRGFDNVGFLVVVGIAANVVLLWTCFRTRRLSARGEAYLRDLRLAFEPLKHRKLLAPSSDTASLLPLLVGVFGVSVLAGTPFRYYPDMFKQASSGGASCGGGCGASCGASCGGGCGGGCGGCGGGCGG